MTRTKGALKPQSDDEQRDLGSVREITLPEPMPHQLTVWLDPARFKLCICGRRWGKTWVSRGMALAGHGPTCRERKGVLDGGFIWWLVPTLKQARQTWDAFEKALKSVWIRRNATERFFDVPGGGRLQIKSGDEPESLRGVEELDGVVIEELKDHQVKTWEQVVRPALADKQAWMVAIGTPGPPTSENLAWRLFEEAKSDNEWRTWQEPTSNNPVIASSEVEAMRKTLGEHAFSRECLAQFVVLGGGLVRREWIRRYDEPPRGLRIIVTADVAVTTKTYSDFTVAAVWGMDSERNLYLLHLHRSKIESPEIIPLLSRICERFSAEALVLEKTGPLVTLNAEARAAQLPLIEVPVPHDKVTRAEPFAAAMQAGRVLFPKDGPGFEWLRVLEDELAIFPDPDGHDDCVDVCSLAVAALPAPIVASQTSATVTPPHEHPQRPWPRSDGTWLRRRRGWL